MRIGLIVDPYGEKEPSGLGRSIFEMAKAIIAAGTEHTFSVYVKRELAAKPKFAGSNWSLTALNSSYLWLTGARRIDRRLDLYIFFTPIIPLFWRPKKSIVVALDFAYLDTPSHSPLAYLHKKVLYLAHRRSLRLATVIVAISHETARCTALHFGIPKEKIQVIHIGYMPLSELQKEMAVPSHYFLFAGVLKERKNVAGIIRAFALFQKHDTQHHFMLMAGKKSGAYYESLVALARELGLDNHVCFLGYVQEEELAYLYNHASALIFPSFIEGFGMPVLEAMHAGLPVITSNTGALAEVAGDAALLVDPALPEDIASAITRLATDSQLRTELVEKGLAQAKNFSWEKTAQQLVKVIESLN